jgi:hypothetical protein
MKVKALVYCSFAVEFDDDGKHDLKDQAHTALSELLFGHVTDYECERIVIEEPETSGSGEPEKSCGTCSKGPRKAKCPTFRAIDCSELNGYPGWEPTQEHSPEPSGTR